MKNLLTICSLLIVFLFSCKKNDFSTNDFAIKNVDAKEWLQKEGGIYKDGILGFKDSIGNVLISNLAWDKYSNKSYKGIEYIEIPFIFNGNKRILKENASIGRSFTLVIRKNSSGNYEGAIRIVTYGSKTVDIENGNYSYRTTQSYNLINGDASTFWYKTDNGVFNSARKLSDQENIAFATRYKLNNKSSSSEIGGSKGTIMLAPPGGGSGGGLVVCTTVTTTSYGYYNYWDGDVLVGVSYPITQTYNVCYDSGTGGSGGSDGSNGSSGNDPNPTGSGGLKGSTDNSWIPSDEDFDITNIDDNIKDALCTKSQNTDGTTKVKGTLKALLTANVSITMNIKDGKIVLTSISSEWNGLTIGSITQTDVTNVPSYSDNSDDFLIGYQQKLGFGKNFNYSMPGTLAISYNYKSNTLSAHWVK